jgi:hypothetical protein
MFGFVYLLFTRKEYSKFCYAKVLIAEGWWRWELLNEG